MPIISAMPLGGTKSRLAWQKIYAKVLVQWGNEEREDQLIHYSSDTTQ